MSKPKNSAIIKTPARKIVYLEDIISGTIIKVIYYKSWCTPSALNPSSKADFDKQKAE